MTMRSANASELTAGEVLVSRSNTGELVGRAAAFPGASSPLHASDLVFRLQVRPTHDSTFVALFLASLQARGYWKDRSSGASSTMKKITRYQLIRVRVPDLPLADQRQVVSLLTNEFSAIARARQLAQEQFLAADSMRLCSYSSAFFDIIPLSVADTPEAPAGWSWRLLTDLARLESGHTPSRSRPDWWNGGVPWIALPDIRAVDGKTIEHTIETTNSEGIAHSAARILPANTVVMSRTASVGFVARMGRPMATSQDFVNWVCGPDLDSEFLMHLLIASRDYIRRLSSGAIHKTVYFPTAAAFRVCIPPIDHQRRIAAELRERLASIAALKEGIAASSEAIGALPTSFLRQSFSELPA